MGPISWVTFGRTEGLAMRAVREVVPPLAVEPEPPPPTPGHTASTVALAPAAMGALIEAQERMTNDAPELVRANTARKLDGLISRLADEVPPPPKDSGYTVRRLETARIRLTVR